MSGKEEWNGSRTQFQEYERCEALTPIQNAAILDGDLEPLFMVDCRMCGQAEGMKAYHCEEEWPDPVNDATCLCWRCHMMWHSRFSAPQAVLKYIYDVTIRFRKPYRPVHEIDFSILKKEHGVEFKWGTIIDGKIGNSSAVLGLAEALKDEDEEVRDAAAEVLGDIGPGAKAAVPALIEVFNDKREIARFLVAEALEKIGREAVPALIEVLKNEDEEVRSFAVWILENINTPEAQKALEEYNKQKSDSNLFDLDDVFN